MAFFCHVCKDYVGEVGQLDLLGTGEESHMVFKHGYIRNYRSIANVDGGTVFQGAKTGTRCWLDAWTQVGEG